MATISIRKLNDDVYELLRIRAAKHGVSMEEEVCQIISQVVAAPERITDVFRKHFGKKKGIDLDLLQQQRKPHGFMDIRDFEHCCLDLINPFE